MTFVLVVQRYIPAYRVPLFSSLREYLAGKDVELLVVHGVPHGLQGARQDSAPPNQWARPVRGATAHLPGGLEPTWRRVGHLTRRADAVVAELGSTSLNSWELLARCPDKTLLWGHGKSYVKPAGRLDSALERTMCKRAAHVLTYTETGKAHLLAQGITNSRVTAIGNSTDTTALRRLKDETHEEAALWWDRLRSQGPVALFVGGLDTDKHIPRLLAAGRAAFRLDPTFRLIVAGSGKDGDLVAAAAREPWLYPMAKASPRDLAGISHICNAIWMPGRVGLVAVDALALGLPVLTTRFPFHAPEIDYLVEGDTVHFLPDNPEAFAQKALDIMSERAAREDIQPEWIPSVEEVASRMGSAIMSVAGRS